MGYRSCAAGALRGCSGDHRTKSGRAIRTALREDGLVVPDISDWAVLAWFAALYPRTGAATAPVRAKPVMRFGEAKPRLPAPAPLDAQAVSALANAAPNQCANRP